MLKRAPMLDATPLLKIYANRRRRHLAAQRPAAAQERQLLKLLRKARNTRFGKDHDFGAIRSVSDFQQRVPLRRYEDFWTEYWRDSFPTLTDVTWPGTIHYFAVTSGTSADTTKYIPCSDEMNRSNVRAGLDLLTHHLANRPDSHIFGGKSFMLGGSTDLVQQASGVWSGDLSGIAARKIPWYAKSRYFPPLKIALIEDWERKVDVLAQASVGEDIRFIGGTPSWLLIFFDRLAANDRKLAEIWPHLELLVHGGVNFAPYRRQFEALLEGSRAEMREVYPASEGFIALADRGYGEGLRMLLDTGLFFEFVPVEELESPNPTRHWIETAETGVNYAILLSTCAGVWSYVVGDTVKLVDRDPPRVLVTGRTSYSLSAFGEHLIDQEIEEAVTHAAEQIEAAITDYSVGAVFPAKKGDLGGHLYIVEFATPVKEPKRRRAFVSDLDEALCETNDDYKAHRAGGYGMKEPVLLAVPPGTFAAWMKKRGKLGGQNKVPRIINDSRHASMTSGISPKPIVPSRTLVPARQSPTLPQGFWTVCRVAQP